MNSRFSPAPAAQHAMLAAMLAPHHAARELQRRALPGRSFSYLGHSVTMLADMDDGEGYVALIEIIRTHGHEPASEIDEYSDAALFLLQGHGSFRIGDQILEASTGDFVWLPRGVPHAFRVNGDRLRALLFISPAGFEDYFRQIARAREPEPADEWSPWTGRGRSWTGRETRAHAVTLPAA